MRPKRRQRTGYSTPQKPQTPPAPDNLANTRPIGSAPNASEERIIREIPLIERYARHNEAEDFKFRAFLKTRLDLTIEQTDAVVRETTEEVWAQIDCTKCAHCCRVLQVVVDSKDIARLAACFGLTSQQFARRYVQVAEDRTRHFAAMPCPFLGEDNRCTVYEDRPQACRDFPYLHKEHFTSRTYGMIANSAVCPIVFNVWQRLKSRLGFRRR